ncbi:MAG TPA: DUF5916 domain-containing protein [Blastocatellia bacterium]|nr:DUF5916 domain-containing protein [Blastocatellia bacterium]
MKNRLLLAAIVLSSHTIYAQGPANSDKPLTASADAPKASSAKAVIVLPPEKARPVRPPLLEKPPIIDGALDDVAWKKASVLKDFYQILPGDNIAPSKQTEVLMGYDSKYLYIAFRAHDDPNKVRATVAKRDFIFDDDYVGIYLDTFNDRRKAYQLFFNPFGIQADGIFSEGREDDFSVDIVMESKGALNEGGYCVEVAIPFKSLRYKEGATKLWGVHIVRRIKRFDNELDSWMPMSREISGKLSQAGHVTGFEDLSPERTLEIIPSLTISERGSRVRGVFFKGALNSLSPSDPTHFVNKPVNFDPGLTVKYSLTSNLVLAFAANPDFAQVEADQPVVTANERFPIFFQEKRPFFLEGIDIFQTALQAVHTRTIVDPDYAVKLTGKQGRSTFGILLASDNAPGNFSDEERSDPSLLPGIARFLDKNAFTGVLRLKRDIGKESSIGMIATSYSFIERHNHVGGFDGRFRLDPQTVFGFQVLGTTSRQFFFDADEGRSIYRTGNGLGYFWKLEKVGRHLVFDISGTGRSSDYRANVGFTRRTNTNNNTLNIRYNSEPKPQAKLISWSIQNLGYINYDWQGRIQGTEQDPSITFNFRHQTYVSLTAFFGREKLYEHEFGPRRAASRPGTFFGPDPERSTSYKGIELGFGTNASKKYGLSFRTWYGWGLFDFDFGGGPRFPRVSPAALLDPGAALDPGPGDQLFGTLTFTYRPTTALQTTFDYTKSRLVRNDTKRVAFDSNIYTLRTTYQFTRFTFVRARLDYDSMASNVRGQFLLGWTPNPGTSFYAGYNDDLNYNGFSPFTGLREPGFRRNNRTFFIKMSYLIRRNL